MGEVPWVVALVASYTLGAVPMGLIVGRVFGNVDVRSYGSGRVGATNVLRTLGWRAAAAVFLFDMTKAAGAVAIGKLLVGDPVAMGLCAVAAIAGHNWSVFINWHGGRGVSSAFGSLLAIAPVAALISMVVALCIMAVTRYVSLGSIVGTSVGMILVLWLVDHGDIPGGYVAYAALTAAIVIFQHRDNIQRLLTGTERKLGDSAERSRG